MILNVLPHVGATKLHCDPGNDHLWRALGLRYYCYRTRRGVRGNVWRLKLLEYANLVIEAIYARGIQLLENFDGTTLSCGHITQFLSGIENDTIAAHSGRTVNPIGQAVAGVDMIWHVMSTKRLIVLE